MLKMVGFPLPPRPTASSRDIASTDGIFHLSQLIEMERTLLKAMLHMKSAADIGRFFLAAFDGHSKWVGDGDGDVDDEGRNNVNANGDDDDGHDSDSTVALPSPPRKDGCNNGKPPPLPSSSLLRMVSKSADSSQSSASTPPAAAGGGIGNGIKKPGSAAAAVAAAAHKTPGAKQTAAPCTPSRGTKRKGATAAVWGGGTGGAAAGGKTDSNKKQKHTKKESNVSTAAKTNTNKKQTKKEKASNGVAAAKTTTTKKQMKKESTAVVAKKKKPASPDGGGPVLKLGIEILEDARYDQNHADHPTGTVLAIQWTNGSYYEAVLTSRPKGPRWHVSKDGNEPHWVRIKHPDGEAALVNLPMVSYFAVRDDDLLHDPRIVTEAPFQNRPKYGLHDSVSILWHDGNRYNGTITKIRYTDPLFFHVQYEDGEGVWHDASEWSQYDDDSDAGPIMVVNEGGGTGPARRVTATGDSAAESPPRRRVAPKIPAAHR